jgi:hypothetical protein
MASYINDLRLKEITTGDEDGTWGTSTNTNLSLIADAFSLGTKNMAADANETFTMPDATADGTRSLYLKITSAVSLTVTRTVTLGPNTVSKVWIIENATTGSQSITIAQGSGATVTIATGTKAMIVTDGAGSGAAVFNANPTAGTVSLTTGVTGTLPVANGGTGITSLGTGVATFLGTPSSANLAAAVTDETGTGALVFGTSPALTTPAITTGINDVNANEILKFTATGSAVNEITLANAAAAANPVISATGSDTNIGISLTPKGTGEVLATASYLTGVFSDKVTAIGNTGASQTIACTSGTVYTATLTGDCTFTLSAANSVASRGTSFTLILTNDATPSRTVTLAGATFKYAGGSIARTTTANAVDIWFFFSPDGGTTFYVSIPMKNVS